MKANFVLMAGSLATTVLASPLATRDDSTDLTALTSTVKVHTANINHTLATLPAANTTSLSGNSSTSSLLGNTTGNANITSEFILIAQALNTTSRMLNKRNLVLAPAAAAAVVFPRQDSSVTTTNCDATCQIASYNELGALTAELAYTMEGCINKNAVDLTSASSVLLTVVKALGTVTTDLEDSVAGIAGIVVKNLQAAMGTEIGGALATFI